MLLLGTAVEKSTLPVDIARKLAQQPPSYNTFNTAADHKYGDGAIFRGFIVDTGAAIVSTVGQFQLSAYQSEYGGELDTTTAGAHPSLLDQEKHSLLSEQRLLKHQLGPSFSTLC